MDEWIDDFGVKYDYNKRLLLRAPTNIELYTIPMGVKRIRDSAFMGCYNLKRITIPNSIEDIGASAFEGCESLVSITIPEKVTIIH